MINETFDMPVVGELTLDELRGNEDQQQLEEVAEAWLRERAEEIGGLLKKQYNPHDFGSYPSFELIVDIDEPIDEEDSEALGEFDRVWSVINRLHEEYYEEFEQYL